MSRSWDLPAGPQAAGRARSLLRSWLTGIGMGPDAEERDAIVLAASEAAANAGVHGRPPVTLAAVTASVPGGTEVIVTVTDASPVVPRQRDAAELDEHGRGLELIDALTDWHNITAGRDCKQVRFGVTVSGLPADGRDSGDVGGNGDPFGRTGSGFSPDGAGWQVLAS